MSAITIENDLVHYEVLGRGRPVIFVHGWLGSWRYWVPAMQYLSGTYRGYALDLWGFGDSGKDVTKYGLREQITLLYQFFERLGIPKAVLVGHSLGAAVVIGFAREYPQRAHRLMLISPPLTDMGGLGEEPPARPTERPSNSPNSGLQFSTTSETLMSNPFRTGGDAGRGGPVLPAGIAAMPGGAAPNTLGQAAVAALVEKMLGVKPSALLAKVADRDTPDIEILRTEVDKAEELALVKSAQSLAVTNLALELKRLTTPTFLLHGEEDAFVPAPSLSILRAINAGKQPGQFLPIVDPAVRHFPMVEMTARFNRLLIDVLEAPDLTNIQFKDQWRRTLR